MAIVTSLALIISAPASANKNETKTFQMSVTIPVIAGLNDRLQNNVLEDGKDLPQNVFIEKMVRDNQTVIVKTIIAK